MNSNNTNNNNNNGNTDRDWRTSLRRIGLFIKRRLKLHRFLLVIDTKKGVAISAITVIVIDLIDLLWNLSMAFGPLNSTMTTLLLIETFLVICVCSVLLYNVRSENKSELRSIMFTWLVVVAIDYCLRASMSISSLIISEKASTTAKAMKSIVCAIMLALVAHCWLCVFTCYDDNNGNMTTVKITPSDDKGRMLLNKRPLMLSMKSAGSQQQGARPPTSGGGMELSAARLEQQHNSMAANMLRAPGEDVAKSRW